MLQCVTVCVTQCDSVCDSKCDTLFTSCDTHCVTKILPHYTKLPRYCFLLGPILPAKHTCVSFHCQFKLHLLSLFFKASFALLVHNSELLACFLCSVFVSHSFFLCYTCVHLYMCAGVHVYMCTCVQVHMCTCVHVYR